MAKKNISETVRELLAPTAEQMGYILWNTEYIKEGAEYVLRITIDCDGGIGIEDCERFHRAIDPILDEADPIETAYRLEVSSPGIERVLTRREHFERCAGEKVEVKLYTPQNGAKKLCGTLAASDEKTITIDCADGQITLDKAAAAQVRTIFEW